MSTMIGEEIFSGETSTSLKVAFFDGIGASTACFKSVDAGEAFPNVNIGGEEGGGENAGDGANTGGAGGRMFAGVTPALDTKMVCNSWRAFCA